MKTEVVMEAIEGRPGATGFFKTGKKNHEHITALTFLAVTHRRLRKAGNIPGEPRPVETVGNYVRPWEGLW